MRFTLDTNILVYAADKREGAKHRTALDLIARATTADCVLTLQSLCEFFNVMLKKAKISADQAVAFVDDWRAVFPVQAADEHTFETALQAVRRDRLPFWDAMLWAAAAQANCRVLITEDMQDGRQLGGITLVNPFVRSNAALLQSVLQPSPRFG